MILVGVADTIDQLIAEHESIDRSLVQVHLPRMSAKEIMQIIDKGLATLDLKIDPDAFDYACSLIQGLPAAAHHLGLQLAYVLIDDNKKIADKNYVVKALNNVIERLGQSLLNDWVTATNVPRKDALFKEVLIACALAPRNELGWFQPIDVREPFKAVTDNASYDIGTYSQHLHLLTPCASFKKDIKT